MSSNKLAVYIHFVWATAGRQPLIDDEMRRPLHRYLWARCEQRGCHPVAVGGTEDHVHLLVGMPATIAISDLLRFVKAGSSRFISHDLRPNSSFAWQGSYGAFSVSARDKATVANYINNQGEHHREGRTWASVEPGDGTDETETDDTAG